MQRSRENAYERFRRGHGVKDDCLKKKSAYFISNHESSVIINVNRTEEDLPAVLIFNNANGPDEVLLYVDAKSDFMTHDYFTWKTHTFFAYEQVEIAKDVEYIKFKALLCNVFVNDSFWAYFKSSLQSAKDNKLGADAEHSTLVPLLIAPRNSQLSIGGRINFNNQVWNIEDGDIFTISGIGYYYLTRGMNDRDDEEYEPEEEVPVNLYYVGAEIKLDTESGYFMTDGKVKLKERTMNSVTILPLEEGKLEITTMKMGSPVANSFIIKENV